MRLTVLMKLVPTKLDQQGELQLDLFNPTFILPNLAYMTVFVAFLCCQIIAGIELSAEGISNMFMILILSSNPLVSIVNGVLARRLGLTLLKNNLKIGGAALFIIVSMLMLYLASTHMFLIDLYEANTWAVPLGSFLSLYGLITLTVNLTLTYLCYLLLDDSLAKMNHKEHLTVGDIVDFIAVYKRCRHGAELPGLYLFASSQLLLILTIYWCVKLSNRTLDELAAINATIVTVVMVTMFVYKAEDMYGKLEEFLVKGRASANVCTAIPVLNIEDSQIADLTKRLEFHTKLNELDTLGPLTGAGFFNIEKRTLVTMGATTVTYAIIMMQWNL